MKIEGHVRVASQERNRHGPGEGGELVGGFQGLREDGVGARLDIELGAANRVLKAGYAAGIGAGDDDEVRIVPGRDGRTQLGGHCLRLDQLLAGQMAATLGKLLILEMNAGHAGRLEQADGALDIEGFAKAGIGVAQER